ncbi:MAG: hypothetical protein GY926_16160 [bacterium]|nr:hypothetical protein [bacterium]
MLGLRIYRTLFLLALGSVFCSRATAQVRMEHSAPWLGGDLSLQIEGAQPASYVRWLVAPTAGSFMLPFGELELERSTIQVLAGSTTDSNGSSAVSLSLDALTYAVEEELHIQTLVADATHPSGFVLGEAKHLRVLGPRFYVGCRGVNAASQAENGALLAISEDSGSTIFEIGHGRVLTGERGHGRAAPRFSANMDVGAVMISPSELLLFDPFFGTELARIPFATASRDIFVHPDTTGVWVLDQGSGPSRVNYVDFDTLTVTNQIFLQQPVSWYWCATEDGREAWIGEHYSFTGQTAALRFNLETGQVGESIPLGAVSNSRFTDLTCAAGQVFVGTATQTGMGNWFGYRSRIQFAAGGHVVTTDSAFTTEFSMFTAAPDARAVLFSNFMPEIPAGSLSAQRLAVPTVTHTFASPWVYLHVDALAVEGTGLWVLDSSNNEPPTATDPGRLYHLDLLTHIWRQHPTDWHFVGPVAMSLLKGPTHNTIGLITESEPAPISITPKLWMINTATGMERTVLVRSGVDSVSGIGRP